MDTKPTNPKDMIGANKLPLHLFPTTATGYGCIALLDGALKYGRHNWRAVGVRPSIYYDAIKRHMDAWMEGEDAAPDSKIPHLAHALAGIAILIDSTVKGNLHDDRYYPQNYREMVEELTPHVARLKAEHADKDPYHYTIDRRGDGDRDLNAPLPEGWEPRPDSMVYESPGDVGTPPVMHIDAKRSEIRQRIIDKYNAPAASIVLGLRDAVHYVREELFGTIEITQEMVDDYNSYCSEPLVTWGDDDGGNYVDPEEDDHMERIADKLSEERYELTARVEQLELDKAALLEGAEIRKNDKLTVETQFYNYRDYAQEKIDGLADEVLRLEQERRAGAKAQRRAIREMEVELENSDTGILRHAVKSQAARIKELEDAATKEDHSAFCNCPVCDW